MNEHMARPIPIHRNSPLMPHLSEEMEELRYDHRRMRRRTVWLVAALPLCALLIAALVIAGMTLFAVLAAILILTAYCI